MTQRRRIVITAILIIAVALLWLFLHETENGDKAVSITIGYRPTAVVDLALLMAIERGDFEKESLSVSLKPYGRADLLIAALKSGQIDGSELGGIS